MLFPCLKACGVWGLGWGDRIMCKREGAEKGEESRGGRRNHSSSSKPRSLPLPRPISWVLSLPGMRINCPGSIPHSSEPFKLSLILIQSCVSHLTSHHSPKPHQSRPLTIPWFFQHHGSLVANTTLGFSWYLGVSMDWFMSFWHVKKRINWPTFKVCVSSMPFQSLINNHDNDSTCGRNIKNLRYADDTTLMAESEEELKSLDEGERGE